MSKDKKKSRLGWIIGSVAVLATTAVLVPPLIKKYSSAAYRASNSELSDDELFPEPTIIEKAAEEGSEEADDNV